MSKDKCADCKHPDDMHYDHVRGGTGPCGMLVKRHDETGHGYYAVCGCPKLRVDKAVAKGTSPAAS